MDHRAALVALLTQRLDTLVEAMPAAQAGDMRSVHQARVATRRLREVLPVIGATLDPAQLTRVRRQVRRMTRALGPVRELDVALGHLDDLAATPGVSARALARVRQHLARERLACRREMLAAVTPGRVAKLRQRLGHVGSADTLRLRSGQALRFRSGPALRPRSGEAPRLSSRQAPEDGAETSPGLRSGQAPRLSSGQAEAGARVARRARRLATAIERAGGLYLPERLHALRIAAKKLRYAMEIARELRRSRATARLTQLKRLQDLLGRVHDFEILIAHTRRVQSLLPATERRLADELDVLVRTLEGECRKGHAAYMRKRPSILQLCDALLTTEPPSSAAVA